VFKHAVGEGTSYAPRFRRGTVYVVGAVVWAVGTLGVYSYPAQRHDGVSRCRRGGGLGMSSYAVSKGSVAVRDPQASGGRDRRCLGRAADRRLAIRNHRSSRTGVAALGVPVMVHQHL
jgi:hypothetical protein